VRRALLYLGLLTILTAIFLIHNHSISAEQPTSRGIGLIIIGAALGVSSTLFQGFYGVKYADAGLMGITSGAALGSLIALKLGNEFGSRPGILITIIFALISFYVFDWAKNRFFVNGLLLTLIFSTPIILLSKNSTPDSTFWLLGSFHHLTKHPVKIFAPFVEVGIITSFFVARKVRSRSRQVKFFVGLGAAFLIGPWVNVTGAILGFGAFIPYLTRKLIQGDTRRLLSYAALTAPILLLLLDILINKLNEISVSAITLILALFLSWFGKKESNSKA
jgi:iron complex transport system permease protein